MERKPLLESCLELFHVKVLRDVSYDTVIKVLCLNSTGKVSPITFQFSQFNQCEERHILTCLNALKSRIHIHIIEIFTVYITEIQCCLEQ